MFDLWKLGAAGGAALIIVSSCVARDRSIENKGAAKLVTTIEKANTNATDQGKRAAQRSTDRRVFGPIDPTTRND